ncbi:hypothetical protein ACP4OV_015081 [Aristida adscensionis]
MAEAVVGVLIGKLGAALANGAATYGASLLCKEASALKGLFGEIRKAEGELEVMRAYLHDAEKFKDADETTSIFVKKIRGPAFRIEDVADEFTYKLEDDKHGGFASKMKKRIKHIKVWRRLALELRDINAELEDAARKRGFYAMPGMGTYIGGSDKHARSRNQIACFARDEDLVGIEDNANKLKHWLVGDFNEKNKVVTVWGMGGAGKTTLVHHVYKTVKADFDVAAWVTVSKSYRVEDLLMKIAREFGISVDPSNMEMTRLVEVIRNYLNGKSCIIGRLLSCKPPTYSEWEKVYEQLLSTTNMILGVDSILQVSLTDLPYELKNCFLNCAIFPEDYELKRRRLIRHWITAGFIKGKDNKTLEQVAAEYLNELVNRSLLQVVEKNEFGRLKSCQMHDAIRATYLRAILAFTRYIDLDLLRPMLASSNLLSTLDLQGTNIQTLPNEIFNLFNLRFLGLRDTRVENLPKAVGRLQNLEVLDAFSTALLSIPEDVAKLKKLRSLYACRHHIEGCVSYYGGVNMPSGIRYLIGLHYLQSVKASLETLCDVATLTELRTFTICDVTSEHFFSLCRSINNMSHLVSLHIAASNKNEILPLEELHLPRTVSKHRLDGQLKQQLPQVLSSWSHLNKLTRLSLILSGLDEDSFPSLMVLHGLCRLDLGSAYDGKKLYLPTLSFPRLQLLIVNGAPKLNQVEIEEGALESLVRLEFLDCPELNQLPCGIEHLKALQDLHLHDISKELMLNILMESEAEECSDRSLVKTRHIRNVTVQRIRIR